MITFSEKVALVDVPEIVANYSRWYPAPDMTHTVSAEEYTHGYDCPHKYAEYFNCVRHEGCTANCGMRVEVVFRMFVGLTLDDREENGASDSDFYAIVWDPSQQRIRRIDYASTRFGGGGGCVVDATEQAKAAAEIAFEELLRARIRIQMEREAAKPDIGKLVVVNAGRKYKGLVGEVTWRGPNQFQYKGAERVRIQPKDGNAFFIGIDQIEVAAPEPPNQEEIDRIARDAASRRCWAAVTSHLAVIM